MFPTIIMIILHVTIQNCKQLNTHTAFFRFVTTATGVGDVCVLMFQQLVLKRTICTSERNCEFLHGVIGWSLDRWTVPLGLGEPRVTIFNVWTGQLDACDVCRFFSRWPDLRDIHRAHRLTQFAMWRRMLTVRYVCQQKLTGGRGDDIRLNCNENFSYTVIVKALNDV